MYAKKTTVIKWLVKIRSCQNLPSSAVGKSVWDVDSMDKTSNRERKQRTHYYKAEHFCTWGDFYKARMNTLACIFATLNREKLSALHCRTDVARVGLAPLPTSRQGDCT